MRRKKLWHWLMSEEHESGQGIVELAIALPLLLLIMGGILDFGWIYLNQYKTQNAAYTGARYAAIHADEYSSLGSSASQRSTLCGQVKSRIQGDFSGWKASDSVSLTADGNVLKVTVQYHVPTLTFVANTIFGDTYTATAVSSAAYK